MNARTKIIAAAAAGFFFAGAAGAQGGGAALCNAQGKVEVMNEAINVDCGSGPAGEMKALSRSKSQYDSGNSIGAEKRAMIEARIDQRLRQLRDEIHHKNS
jgi:hypothetical protein